MYFHLTKVQVTLVGQSRPVHDRWPVNVEKEMVAMLTDFAESVLFLCELIVLTGAQTYSVTPTKYGPVRGVAVGSSTDRVYTYLGVPFAKPPTGDLRFKQPQSPDNWTAPRDALEMPRDCMQILRFGVENLGINLNTSEDCLYLNVYTPSSGSNGTQMPVMVWIYGGAFIMGSASAYDGTELARKNVVVVTFNYRIDAFGFLSTEDDAIPGNFGLLDQIFALKWVKENIASFGGDPNQVTLFGESAGGCSVAILTLSPLAKGLFKRAIMESGSALSPLCISYPATTFVPRNVANLIGSKVNCNSQDSTQLLQCLQKVNAEILLNASVTVQNSQLKGLPAMVLRSRVERTFGVLPEYPDKLLTSGQFERIEAIRGFNTNEQGATRPDSPTGISREQFRDVVRELLNSFSFDSPDVYINEYENLYLGNSTDTVYTFQRSVDALSEFSFILPALLETELASAASPDKKQYLYEFNYRKSFSTLPPWVTAEHTDELPFVFHYFNFPLWASVQPPSSDDLSVSEQMLTLWTNFAKTGDPTSSVPTGVSAWTPFGSSQQSLLKINTNSKMVPSGRTVTLELYRRLLRDFNKSSNGVVIG
ncbi:Acylcarnitine hydrolase [Bulinus truncatus]|nr:Acylcarnitine hydrolase [Bulinus truncatus]